MPTSKRKAGLRKTGQSGWDDCFRLCDRIQLGERLRFAEFIEQLVWSKYSSRWNQKFFKKFFSYELSRATRSSCLRRKMRLAVICNVL
jgi:hypothetical protein